MISSGFKKRACDGAWGGYPVVWTKLRIDVLVARTMASYKACGKLCGRRVAVEGEWASDSLREERE